MRGWKENSTGGRREVRDDRKIDRGGEERIALNLFHFVETVASCKKCVFVSRGNSSIYRRPFLKR